MAFADRSVYHDVGDGSILGGFREKDTKNTFEFSLNNDRNPEFPFSKYPHKIWVTTPIPGIDSGYRYGWVGKTRCKIVCDVDRVETWFLSGKGRIDYNIRPKG